MNDLFRFRSKGGGGSSRRGRSEIMVEITCDYGDYGDYATTGAI